MRAMPEPYVYTQRDEDCGQYESEGNKSKSHRTTIHVGGKAAWQRFSHFERVKSE